MIKNKEHTRRRSSSASYKLARGLGVFSIALGLSELIGHKTLSKQMGMKKQEGLIRAYGWREIATGAGILASSNPKPWIFARLAGDVLDLTTLGMNYGGKKRTRNNIMIAAGAVAGATILDAVCAGMLQKEQGRVKKKHNRKVFNYSDRTGFPKSIKSVRGIAFDAPNVREFRAPAGPAPMASSKKEARQ